MIDRDELRRVMELEGHDPETIDKVLAWYYGTSVSMEAMVSLLDLLRQQMDAAAQSLTELWEDITGDQVLPRPARLPRPPRNTCPKNRAVQQTQRPARVARSSCRKVRR